MVELMVSWGLFVGLINFWYIAEPDFSLRNVSPLTAKKNPTILILLPGCLLSQGIKERVWVEQIRKVQHVP